jgi:hypothetical protein
MTAPSFARVVDSAGLYALSSAGEAGLSRYWAGYRAATPTSLGPSADLGEVWGDICGTFLFLGALPPDLATFAAALEQAYPRAQWPTLRMLWIANPLDPQGNWQAQTLLAGARGSGRTTSWTVARDAAFGVGTEYRLEIGRGTALGLAATDPEYAVTVGAGAGFLGPDNSWPLSGTALALAGQAVGSWGGGFSLPAGRDGLADLGVKVSYAAPATDGAVGDEVESLDLAVLAQGAAALPLTPRLDPVNPLVGDRTYLGLVPLSGAAPALPARFRTNRGYATTLQPQALGAPLGSARFVFGSAPTKVPDDPRLAARRYHLTPDGPFALAVLPPKGNAAVAGEPSRLMLGLSGLEYALLSEGAAALVLFAAGEPAYAPGAGPESPPTPPGGKLLDGLATTAYATVLPAAAAAPGFAYYAQPRKAPLYSQAGAPHAGMLGFLELKAASLPSWTTTGSAPPALPAPPLAGARTRDSELARRLEAAALAPARRLAIGLRADGLGTGVEEETLAVTPQGLLAGVTAAEIDQVVIANPPGNPTASLDRMLGFTDVGPHLRAALQSNQLFFVVASPQKFMDDSSVRFRLDPTAFALARGKGVPAAVVEAVEAIAAPGGRPVDYVDEAAFETAIKVAAGSSYDVLRELGGFLKTTISGWTFQLSPWSWRTDPEDSPTIMLAKFASRSLGELVDDAAAWGWPEAGVLPDGDTQETVREIFAQARARSEDPTVPADDPYASFYRDVVNEPGWNGFLFLNAPVAIAELPTELQFMAAGIDPGRFYAHHIGFAATPVETDAGGAIAIRQTGSFGLIDYHDPVDLVLEASNPEPRFDFKTLRLTARFANAALVDFSAQVELMVNSLFETELTKLDPTHGNNLLLNGVSQRQGDKISYVFQLEGRNLYATTRSILNSIEIEGVRLLTSSGTSAAGNVHAEFILAGTLRFIEPGEFDPFCFGPVIEEEVEVDGWLRFDGLAVGMSFALATPEAHSFTTELGGIGFDPGASRARKRSLLPNFPVALTGFVSSRAAAGGPGQTPADLGFAPVDASLEQMPLEPPWFGLLYTLDLGTLGALSGGASVSLTVLAAWAPGEADEDRPVYVGLRPPGASGRGAQWSLQEVIKLGFRNFRFQTIEAAAARAYMLRLHRFSLSILGLSVPPGSLDLVITGSGQDAGAVVGWYAAYDAGEDTKKNSVVALPEGR